MVCFAFVALAAPATADDKTVDKDKIVGTWKLTKSGGKAASEKVVIQFTKDGKLKIAETVTNEIVGGKNKGKKSTKEQTLEGTYKLAGNKLSMTMIIQGREEEQTITIKTLTDMKLVVINPAGKDDEFEKTK